VKLQRWLTSGILLPAIALGALVAGHSEAADPRETGPRTLIITYRTSPADRTAFRRELEGAGIRQLQRWKDDGVLQGFHLLYNRYVDSGNWDAIALLSFAKDSGIERWKKIETEFPAGIPTRALSLTTSIETVPADLTRRKATPQSADGSVFLVIPYEYSVPINEYIEYLDDYVLPQTDGWMQEGVLSSYSVYLARYPAGRPWQSLLVLEYKDDQALGARDATVAKVRARLRDIPKWKAIGDSKKSMRVEKQSLIADPIAVR